MTEANESKPDRAQPAIESHAPVIVIGGGPAGLSAAEVIVAAGHRVELYDAMASVGRKFLMAGKGGLNLTHSEPLEAFLSRFGAARQRLEPLLRTFDPMALRRWAQALGIETFVGTSGRVFPREMKAAPLLRAWLHGLRANGVRVHTRHRWLGWNADGALRFAVADGEIAIRGRAVVLALGGGSWARLGSDGAWVEWLRARQVPVHPLLPANCGFDVAWSEPFRQRHAGAALKSVRAGTAVGAMRLGEFVITDSGVEGSLIYALSSALRDQLMRRGEVTLFLDLAPGRERNALQKALSRPRAKNSLANHVRRNAGIDGVKFGLLREVLTVEQCGDPVALAAAIKALPLKLIAPRPLDEAISSAGGVAFEALDEHLMLRTLPGVFCAGEMLDWEAPTGGYLLSASIASGRHAGLGVARWLAADV